MIIIITGYFNFNAIMMAFINRHIIMAIIRAAFIYNAATIVEQNLNFKGITIIVIIIIANMGYYYYFILKNYY